VANETNISWTDATFSPWRGCQKISKGCENCYADTFSHRNPKLLGVFGTEAQGGTRVVASDDMWRQPLKWNAQGSSRVFCASIADVFEDWSGPMLNHKGEQLYRNGEFETPLTMDDVRRRLFDLIDATRNLTWQLLTKRPENILGMINRIRLDGGSTGRIREWDIETPAHPYFRKNVWLGTTVENQEYADKRIPELLKCGDMAPVLFLSCEPLLGPLDLKRFLWPRGWDGTEEDIKRHTKEVASWSLVTWVIAGCESGPNRRETKLEWVRDLRDQCEAAGVAFFVKQLSIDGKVTDDVNQFPEDLRIQEFPNQ
jgi:protein gp37